MLGGEGGHPTFSMVSIRWSEGGWWCWIYFVGTPGTGVLVVQEEAFPSFPPVIEPGIPASVRPTWTPVVGPTGIFTVAEVVVVIILVVLAGAHLVVVEEGRTHN